MKAEKVRFSLEEAKRLETANDVAKKVKWLQDTAKNLTEMSSFFSEIAGPVFQTGRRGERRRLIFRQSIVDRLVDGSSRQAVCVAIGIENLMEVFPPLDG